MGELKLTDDAFKDGAWIWVILFLIFFGEPKIGDIEKENRPV